MTQSSTAWRAGAIAPSSKVSVHSNRLLSVEIGLFSVQKCRIQRLQPLLGRPRILLLERHSGHVSVRSSSRLRGCDRGDGSECRLPPLHPATQRPLFPRFNRLSLFCPFRPRDSNHPSFVPSNTSRICGVTTGFISVVREYDRSFRDHSSPRFLSSRSYNHSYSCFTNHSLHLARCALVAQAAAKGESCKNATRGTSKRPRFWPQVRGRASF